MGGRNSLENSNLLIVDDEPALLLGYRIILERHGYAVTVAGDSAVVRAFLIALRDDARPLM